MNLKKVMVGLVFVLGVQFFAEARCVSNQVRKSQVEETQKVETDKQKNYFGASFFASASNNCRSSQIKSLQNFLQTRSESLNNFVTKNFVCLAAVSAIKKFEGPAKSVFNGVSAIVGTLAAVILF